MVPETMGDMVKVPQVPCRDGGSRLNWTYHRPGPSCQFQFPGPLQVVEGNGAAGYCCVNGGGLKTGDRHRCTHDGLVQVSVHPKADVW